MQNPPRSRGRLQHPVFSGTSHVLWAALFGLVLLCFTTVAFARTPEMALDARGGVWIAAGEVFVQQARDRWSVFPAPGTVNELAVDELTVWVATDEGLVRFESGSRRLSHLTMDDGLPSDAVSAVAFDEEYVWFGTNKGLVRYRKIDRELRVYSDEDGLPHRAVNDILSTGKQVWFATRGGLAVYDPESDGLRAYTTEEGLGSDYVEELFQVGDNLWCLTDEGLSRLEIEKRRFTNFTFEDLGGEEVKVFTPDGQAVWIGTEKGITEFDANSDAFNPFTQQSALTSSVTLGIQPFTDYLFLLTGKEIVQYHKEKRTFRLFSKEADNLARVEGAVGSVLANGLLTLLFEDGAEVYDIQRDLWISRTLKVTEAEGEGGSVTWEAWVEADIETPIDAKTGSVSEERHATVSVGAGVGWQDEEGRSLDLTVELDYGEVELSGIRNVQVKGEYLGTDEDVVREARLGDRVEHRTVEEGIERPISLLGEQVRLASKGKEPTINATIDSGLRRGLTQRDFLTGPRQEVYALSKRYILPQSEQVYLDGELLTSGTDYVIIYPAGQLAFLDLERVDDLSIIEVEYEYDVVPKKGLGVISLLDLLPADNEVGSWQQRDPTVVSEESGLYAQINGAAPKYIDRGWVRSVFAEYEYGGRTIKLAIHDMGSEQQAVDIFNYDLPPAREPVADRENMVLNIGLASSYEVKAYYKTFYIELSIDEKSESTKQSVKLFAAQVQDRGETAGEHSIDDPYQALAAARVALSPGKGFELGGRVVQLYGTKDREGITARRQLTGILDARYQRSIDGGGQITGYLEAAGSHGQRGVDGDGFAGLGRLRINHPWLEGSLTGRYNDSGFSPLGSNQTMFGTLQDETRLAATAYPARWLPTTVFLSRQASRIASGDGTALVRHALFRTQLTHKDAPTTSLQIGHSMLNDALGTRTGRLKLSGQTDYDLAQGILAPLGMRRFILRGLYSISDASTHQFGDYTGGDRTETARVEAKLAPNATEQAWALFRTHRARNRLSPESDFDLASEYWELNAGARSSIIPGLIPLVNHTASYNDGTDTTGDRIRSASVGLSGELGVYPGDWFPALTPVAMVSRYTLDEAAETENELKTGLVRTHQIDNRITYNDMSKLTIELYERYGVALSGETQERMESLLELRNRFIYRPIFASPITLRLDYIREEDRNDLSVDSNAPEWGSKTTYEGSLEWLMRWTRAFSTQIRSTYSLSDFDALLVVDPTTQRGQLNDYQQQSLTQRIEFRLLLQQEDGSLYLIQSNQLTYWFGDPLKSSPTEAGAINAMGFDHAVGFIWSLSDNLYLDAEVAFRHTDCFQDTCADPNPLVVPRFLLTGRL